MKIICFLLTVALSNSAFSISAIEQAVSDAGVLKNDSLDIKIDKTLRLLNEERYFIQKSASIPPKESDGNPYELDSLRTPEQILQQKIGGSCGSSALAFAAILQSSGVDAERIRVVGSVVNSDLAEICPTVGEPRIIPPRNGASGHVFVALQFPNQKWQIINSIDGSRTYERAPWFPPDEVQKLMKNGLQIPFAAYKKLPRRIYKSGLTVFQSWKLDDVPIHTFQQRFDLIASGQLSESPSMCRFTSP